MLLAQAYANSLSVDLTKDCKPILPTQYYPTPDKYITIQNSSGMPAKDYDLWQLVIDLIHPYLESAGISIVQLGKGDIKPLNKVNNLTNQTSFAQSVYVLRNALLHMGNDSWACHAAVEVPVVALYGSTSVSAHSPCHYHPKSQFIESHRWSRNCSFNPGENPKSINLIDPYLVAREILNNLGISFDFKLLNSSVLFVGDGYIQGNQINIIPDQIINPDSIAPGILNLRADLFFDLNLIIQNIQMRQYALILDRPIEVGLIKQLKPNIPTILYEVQDDTDANYLKSLLKTGVNLQLWTKMPESDHKNIKLEYLDLPLISRRDNVTIESVQEAIKRHLNIKEDTDLTKEFSYYSRKHYLSQGKIYPSLYAWRNQISGENIEESSRADFSSQEFLNELGHFLIFSQG